MNCDLWRSHGRIFAHWTCLYFSLYLWLVSGICKIKPEKKTFFKPKNLYKKLKPNFCLKDLFFPTLDCLLVQTGSLCSVRSVACATVLYQWTEKSK